MASAGPNSDDNGEDWQAGSLTAMTVTKIGKPGPDGDDLCEDWQAEAKR